MDVKVTYNDVYKTVEVLREKGTTAVRHLYEVMNDVYNVYTLIKQRDEQKLWKAKTIKAQLNKRADKLNIEKSSNIETALVRYVFGGLERRQVSKYAKALKNAYNLHRQEIEECGDFATWLKEIGGLTQLHSKPKFQVKNETFKKLFEQKPLTQLSKFRFGNVNVNDGDVCLLVCKKTKDGMTVYGVDTNEDRIVASSKQAIANNELKEENDNVIRIDNEYFNLDELKVTDEIINSSKIKALIAQLKEREAI